MFITLALRACQVQAPKPRPGWFRTIISSVGFSIDVAALVMTLVACLRPNTLDNNGNWLCSKTMQGSRLTGADNFKDGTDALKDGHLNLGAWFGFQEVLLDRLRLPERIGFRFMLAHGATLTCVFGKDEERFEGIRFSVRPDKPSAYISGLDTGEFTEKRLLALPAPLTESVWHQSTISFSATAIGIEVDGQAISIPLNSPGKRGRVGFRGGHGDTFVDDVAILERGHSRPYTESFEKHVFTANLAMIILIAAAYLFIPILFTVALLKQQWRPKYKLSVAAYALLSFGMVAFYLYILVLSNQYPPTEQQVRSNTRHSPPDSSYVKESQEEFSKKYLMRPAQDSTKIVFVGASQALGDGARNDSESFVKVLESLLNTRADSPKRIECLNGSVRGACASQLAGAYAETYIKAKPALTVVSLSYTDFRIGTPDESFAASLRSIVQTNQAAGIKTLFVLEAASPEVFPDGCSNHAIMSRVALDSGIPFVNAFEYMKMHCDDGFLFWDSDHPTSYGHRLLAECLLPQIAAQLGIDTTH